MDNTEKVILLVSEALETAVTLESSSENTIEWDSLGQLAIISALDKVTNGKAGAVSSLVRISSMRGLIEELERLNLWW